MYSPAPHVPEGFRPSLRWAFVYGGHVRTDRSESYRELVHATGLAARHKFITYGLTGMGRRWNVLTPAPLGYNLSLVQWVSKQPGFKSWMEKQPDIGPNTIRDILDFVEGLERIGILPR